MLESGRRQKAVQRWEPPPGALVARVERCPLREHRGVEGWNAPGRPPFDTPIPTLDLVAAVSGIEKVNPLQHFAKREGAEPNVGIMLAKPRNDFRFRPLPRRLAEDVGIDEVGHGASVEVQVSLDHTVPLDFPILDRAVQQNVGEGFLGLQARIGFRGNHHSHRATVARDGLCTIARHFVDQLAQLVLRLLEGPRRTYTVLLAETIWTV